MQTKKIPGRWIFFTLFAVSGFSGLIYESIWSHYLKLFLGHAAYAQTLVLIIFMGGMALGAWLVGRYTGRIRSLLRWYAIIEGIIGLLAIIFHPLFISTMDGTYYSLIPQMDSALLISIVKWGLAALLILPQSILLGATFPLMSGGVIRCYPDKPGRSLAILYFTNSLGAAVGVLASGFWLIEMVGLPGTIITAGIINILLAVAVLHLSRNEPQKAAAVEPQESPAPGWGVPGENLSRRLLMGFMMVAALTGTASFLYEIGWIRMLSLVLGSSTHAFELMLSAFILGLAIGGFWISRRIDRLKSPVKMLGYIQLVMGGLALMTLLSYGETFQLMGYAIEKLPKTGNGYFLFNLLSHGISMLLMIPATICAGMTLPLITYYLLFRGYGEGSIGKVYAANTVGSIVGVILAVHFAMPLLGVKNVIVLGGTIDIVVGVLLLRSVLPEIGKIRWAVVTSVFAAVILLSVFVLRLNPLKMASGVFRHGMPKTEGEVLFHKDGKTASIDVVKFQAIDSISITTNGKPDAAISYSDTPRPDESTMVLSGVLPMTVHPGAKTVANVGLGSGLTSHVLLANPDLETVVTIEMEPAIVEGAKLFGDRVANNYNDPRGRIVIDDAKTFFYTGKQKYDIITSVPSNPWVSGVAGLFSIEFYRLVHYFLEDEGVFSQWIHLYEMNIPLVASIMKGISATFEDYAIFLTNDTNMVVLAAKRPLPKELSGKVFAMPGVRENLARIGIHHVQDLYIRRLGTKKSLEPLFNSYDIPSNSDFYPVLDIGAARARFMGNTANGLNDLFSVEFPVTRILEKEIPPARSFYSHAPFGFWRALRAREARAIYQYCIAFKNPNFIPTVAMNERNFQLFRGIQAGEATSKTMQDIVFSTLTYLSPQEMALVWSVLESSPSYPKQPEGFKKVLALSRTMGEGRYKEALELLEGFLPSKIIEDHPRNQFLLKSLLLAHMGLGDTAAAQAAWDRYDFDRGKELPLDLRILGAHLGKVGSRQ